MKRDTLHNNGSSVGIYLLANAYMEIEEDGILTSTFSFSCLKKIQECFRNKNTELTKYPAFKNQQIIIFQYMRF